MAHSVVGRCPVCEGVMDVARLYCPACDTSIEGRFALGRFWRLNAEQLAFAEIFIRCEGKITRVEEVLGISYPTVRNRLNDLIRALDCDVAEEDDASGEKRRAILQQLSAGEISSDEAVRRLKAR
ncbi:MAG: DUF2089 domain-containing protein [Chloroflexi bacterium]|nr:DUF2089 domain-containing protein [Chloroflexota bacterium]